MKKNILMKQKNVFQVKNKPDSKSLSAILELEKVCFPVEWQYPDAREYYQEMLEKPSAIHLFLESEGKCVGYLLAVPQDDVHEDLVVHDPEFTKDKNCYYLETIGVHPEYLGQGGGKMLVSALVDEVRRRGDMDKISAHARTLNGFSLSIRKSFSKDIIEIRDIDHWHFGGGEPYEYIKWKI